MYKNFDQPGTTDSSIFWHLACSSESFFLCRPLQETEHPYRAAPLAPFRNNCNPSPTHHPKPSKPEEITDPLLKKPRISHSPKETVSEQTRERTYKHGVPEDMAVTPGRSSVHLILCLLGRNSRGQMTGKDPRPQQTPLPSRLLKLETETKNEENIKNVFLMLNSKKYLGIVNCPAGVGSPLFVFISSTLLPFLYPATHQKFCFFQMFHSTKKCANWTSGLLSHFCW